MNIRLKKEFAVNHTGLRRFLPRCTGVKPFGFTLIELLVVIAIIAMTTSNSIKVNNCFFISFRLLLFLNFEINTHCCP